MMNCELYRFGRHMRYAEADRIRYDKRHFTDLGMEHAEMYFDDGTCPTDEIVRDFIDRSIEQIEQGKKVAVHCKAGLGRTGVLIGGEF